MLKYISNFIISVEHISRKQRV